MFVTRKEKRRLLKELSAVIISTNPCPLTRELKDRVQNLGLFLFRI